MIRRRIWLPFALVAALLASAPARAEAPKVVASIKPVHSLVATVMRGVGVPHLIVAGAASPHSYSLRPSDAGALAEAEAVVWVGPGLEAFLARPIASLAGGARIVTLADAAGLETLAFREGGPFEAAAAAAADGHADAHDVGHDDGHGDGHGGVDLHLWLDPANAGAMAREIARALAAVDPANAARYVANADAFSRSVDALAADIAATLAPVRARPFVVFHDAYQYFERRFGLNAVGAVTVSPQAMRGARRIAELRARIERLGAVCVFAEPQFDRRPIAAMVAGTAARAAILDPLGVDIAAGPDHYPRLMRRMAAQLAACLADAG